MAAKFEIYKDKKGEYRFKLKAANGEPILRSEGYTNKQGCQTGIESVKKNAPTDSNYDRQKSSDGQFYFNLKAQNKEIIGTSETYKTSTAIDSVKANATTPIIVDLT
jgi:uncharacterized protein YegP (UPF0339 family)